jgi:hypothetical protein
VTGLITARHLVLAAKSAGTTASNLNALLRPIQWLAVALIFLFFLRVSRAVFVEVRPAGSRQSRRDRRRTARDHAAALSGPKPKKRSQFYLEIVEPAAQSGRTFDLEQELTIGRSPGCGIPTTHDRFTSTLHARIFYRSGHYWVEDLGSTNGTFINAEKLTRPTKLGKGDLVQAGGTVFEVTR